MKIFLALSLTCSLAALDYELNFVGFSDEAALKSMFDVSTLVNLQERPPASINGIRYRAAADVPELIKVLHAYGYYDAQITTEVDEESSPVQVSLLIRSGPQYTLASYDVLQKQCNSALVLNGCALYAPPLGEPAKSIDIVNAELEVLSSLADCGYPLAAIQKRNVVVDMMEKEVKAAVCVNEGPLAHYGPTMVDGLHKVRMKFIEQRIPWHEGDVYSAGTIDEVQRKLLSTNLFSSVIIEHEPKLDAEGNLPIRINLAEAKHRLFSIGVFYATVDGWGGQFSWTNRNWRGMGETLSVDGSFSTRYLEGAIEYKVPDFFSENQSFRALAEIERENIFPYTNFAYRGAWFVDGRIKVKSHYSFGFEVERYNITHSASNGVYLLASVPVLASYLNCDDLLNATEGYTLVYQAHPFQSLMNKGFQFIKQRFTGTFYVPCYKKKVIFAGRAQFGSIAGTRQTNVPLPLLFLGGSEDELRGYRYMTVSPLNLENQPLGGRSAVYLSAELRLRITHAIGLVPFADFGTVTLNEWPTFDTKWFKSVGGGLRYFTYFGPIRADIGFPLNRRKGIDSPYRVYVSVGQTF